METFGGDSYLVLDLADLGMRPGVPTDKEQLEKHILEASNFSEMPS